MRALVFDRFGPAEVLRVEQIADPVPGPGQALVRLKCAGLNFADIYRRNGNYHLSGSPPWILGYEGAGIVESIADDSGIRPGDRVAFADSPHSNAELAIVDIDRLVPLPDDIGFETAAALMLQGLTAQYLARDSYQVRPGDWALVHAGAGGVGLLLTQLLKLGGARVMAVASTLAKRAAVEQVGADHALDPAGWVEAVRDATDGRGADIVYDSVGRTLGQSLDAVRIGGTVVFYGMAGGDPDPVDPRLLMDRSLRLVGGDLWNVLTSAEIRRARASELFGLVREGALDVRIAATFPLEEGADAHRLLESREVIGKVVLTM